MTTHDALLAAVIAAPDDDLPRLVYADHLDELDTDDSRAMAEFIRVQVELAKRPGEMPLVWRAQTLSDGRDWFAPFERHVDGSGMVQGRRGDATADVTRGFVSEVRCTLAEWCGGVCHHCHTTGYEDYPARGTCVRCHGEGETTAIGPAVVRSHPVQTVRLSDVRPNRHRNADGSERFGYELMDDNARDEWQLPACIFNELPPGYLVINRNHRWWGAVEDAERSLSTACINWAVKERSKYGSQENEPCRQQVSQTHSG